ncbi:MAG: murein biosynthesis integral membrane protein MurJ [Streptosporangiaceae bacterium]
MSTPAPQAGWTAPDGGRGRRRASGRHHGGSHAAGAGGGMIQGGDPGYPADALPGDTAATPRGDPAEAPPGDPGDPGGTLTADPGYPGGEPPADPDPSAAAPGSGGSLLRSSSVMAVGTLASRGTGFLRTLMLTFALGVTASTVGNAYNNANTLPNAVYDLLLGGILSSVVVPLLVGAAKRDRDRGEAYTQRMFTLATVALFGLTVVATAAAPLLVELYAHALSGAERHLTVIFAFFFIPQIFFYGVSSMAGGVLNARDRFAAPMWTPVINNIVVILVLLLFIATGGIGTQAGTISGAQIQLLGFGTTLGIVAQTAALFPALRRAGFRWRPRFDFRRAEVREIRRMAAPLFGYIVTTQVSFLVVQNVANAASVHRGAGYDSFSSYSIAWQLFQMPYAIVGVSVITALLPRMSAHAAERRLPLVRDDFSTGVRLSSVIVVPAALLLIILGGPLALFLLGHGSTTPAEARYIGEVFGIFSLGLVPYMMFQLLLRVFYSLHDSRTPMFVGVAVMATNIAASLLALNVLPTGHVVEGLGAAFGIANVVGAAVSWRILSRRLGGLDGRRIADSLGRMHMAAVPALLFAWAVTFMVGVIIGPGAVYGFVTLVLGGSGGLLLYLLFSRALGIGEVAALTSTVKSRLHR